MTSKSKLSQIDRYFYEYSASHQNKVNKLIHWFCVPTILINVVGLLSVIQIGIQDWSVAHVVALFAMAFYVYMSPKLAVGMALVLYTAFYINAQVKSYLNRYYLFFVLIICLLR